MEIINGISVQMPESMAKEEAAHYVVDELVLWRANGKEINHIELSLDGNEVIVKAYEKSPIKRVRRITGYLSTTENFNDAKRSELHDRVTHFRN